jgi:hypothetical protein
VSLASVKAAIERHRRIFDLAENNLGRDFCKAATDGVQANIAGEHDPDGNPWPPLSPDYDEWKSFMYPGQPMGVLHQVMANPHEVAGEVEVTPELATVTYGISEQAREEAAAFQARRKFWGLTEDSRKASKAILDERFRNGVK